MTFEYRWDHQEANFGPPITAEIEGGTHLSCECILTFERKFVALRRSQAIPGHELPPKALHLQKPLLYFVHNLPRWGETLDVFVQRVIQEQTGVGVNTYKVVHLTMQVYPDTKQWAWTPFLLVELNALPEPGIYGNEVTEVVQFTRDSVPDDFGWWEKDELEEFIQQHVNRARVAL